jgi:hypothetical protein
MALETADQHEDGSEVYLPGDREINPAASIPTIPPDTQMSPPPRGDGDDYEEQ